MPIDASIIVATQKDFGIGRGLVIPWYIKEDLQYFRAVTIGDAGKNGKKNVLLMGKNTHDGIGKALPGRINLVLSRSKFAEKTESIERISDELVFVKDLPTAREFLLKESEKIGTVFISGGEQIYTIIANDSEFNLTKFYLSLISTNYDCDKLFNYTECLSKNYNMIEESKNSINCKDYDGSANSIDFIVYKLERISQQ